MKSYKTYAEEYGLDIEVVRWVFNHIRVTRYVMSEPIGYKIAFKYLGQPVHLSSEWKTGVAEKTFREIVNIRRKAITQKQTRNSFQTRIKHAYITRITLNPVNPDVRKVLRSPEAIHAVVSAATSGSSRPLWRLDGDRLYIVSDQLDTDRLEARLGKPIINTLDYRPFLDKLQNGETRRFTLTATPVVSKDGKRTPLRTPAGMHQWAEGKLTQAGARLDALDILDVHATRFNRQGRKLTFHTVEYTGEITITDRDKLTQTMLSGIGHGKAYGLGLMLLF